MSTTELQKPEICISQTDFERLNLLAEENENRIPAVTDRLFMELDRATIVPDDRISDDVLRMGSFARFTSDTEANRLVSLVYPGMADIESGRLSILTPIGVALIGLSKGQSIDWRTRDGQTRHLTVEDVYQPNQSPPK